MTVTLQIKRNFLLDILSGKKKTDFRDYSERYLKMFCNMDEYGNAVDYKPIKEVIFFNGYNTDRPIVKMQVKEIYLEAYVDEFGKETEKEYFGIELGAVLSRQNI